MTRTPFSASNFHRRLTCPGSLAMEKDLPEVESEFSVEGQRLHHAAATGDMTGLTQEETDLVAEKLVQRDRFLESVGCGDLPGRVLLLEIELKYSLSKEEYFFNHADVIATGPPGVVAIVDYKFGYEEVDPPDMNTQLAVYIAAAWERWSADEYYGLIIPRFGKPAAPVKYTREEIPALRRMIDDSYRACTPTAARNPGLRQCRYCKGFQLGVCKEASAMALSASAADLTALSAEAMLSQLAPEKRTQLFDAFKMAEDLRKTYTRAAKRLLEKDPDYIPGYRLSKEGETRAKVTDMLSLRDRLQGIGISDTLFVSRSSMSNKVIEDMVRAQTDLKGGALKEKVDSLTKGLVDITPVERSLERMPTRRVRWKV